MNPLTLLVRKLSLHAELAPADGDAILALPCTVRMLEPASYLIREGEAPNRCAVMISGFAFRQKLAQEGARQIVSVHIGGDPLELQSLFLDVADHSVQTLTRAEVAFIPRERLQELARANPAIARAFFINILIEASIFREWVTNVGRRDAKARVAHLLCELAVRLQTIGLARDHSYELPMTQEQIADAVGLTAVHVNRTLKALEADGLIARNRRIISARDWSALRELSGFSARYLHLDRQRAGGGGVARSERIDA